jgi:hypothetical protein
MSPNIRIMANENKLAVWFRLDAPGFPFFFVQKYKNPPPQQIPRD